MTTETLSISEQLAHHTGSECVYRHSFMRFFTFTEGCRALGDLAGAHWLIDLAASHQTKPRVRREPFQLWSIRKLGPEAKNMAVAECRRDSGLNPVSRQYIPFTDFPFDDLGETFEWYVEYNGSGFTMMLKSER